MSLGLKTVQAAFILGFALLGLPAFAADCQTCGTVAPVSESAFRSKQSVDEIRDRLEREEIARCERGEFRDPETGIYQLPPSYDASCQEDFACNLANSLIDLATVGNASIWGNNFYQLTGIRVSRHSCLNNYDPNCTSSLAKGFADSLIADVRLIRFVLNWAREQAAKAMKSVTSAVRKTVQEPGALAKPFWGAYTKAANKISQTAHFLAHADFDDLKIRAPQGKGQYWNKIQKKLKVNAEILVEVGKKFITSIAHYIRSDLGCGRWEGTTCTHVLTSFACADCSAIFNMTCGLAGAIVGQGKVFKLIGDVITGTTHAASGAIRSAAHQNPALEKALTAASAKVAPVAAKAKTVYRKATSIGPAGRERERARSALQELHAKTRAEAAPAPAPKLLPETELRRDRGRYIVELASGQKSYTARQLLAAVYKHVDTSDEAIEAIEHYLIGLGKLDNIDAVTQLHILGKATTESITPRWFKLRDAVAREYVPSWESSGQLSIDELIETAQLSGGTYPSYFLPYLKNPAAIRKLTAKTMETVEKRANAEEWLVGLKSLAQTEGHHLDFVRSQFERYLSDGMVYFGKKRGEDVLFKIMRDRYFFEDQAMARAFIEAAGRKGQTGTFVTRALESCGMKAGGCEGLIEELLENPWILTANNRGNPVAALKRAVSTFRELTPQEEIGLSALIKHDSITMVLKETNPVKVQTLAGQHLAAVGKTDDFGLIMRHLAQSERPGAAKSALNIVRASSVGPDARYYAEFLEPLLKVGSPRAKDEAVQVLTKELKRLGEAETGKKELILSALEKLHAEKSLDHVVKGSRTASRTVMRQAASQAGHTHLNRERPPASMEPR